MNTNSNTYTIAYSAVMVVVVAFLLAFVFSALKPTQDKNVALDKKKQILYALNIRGLANEEAAAKYAEVVLADDIIGKDGKVLQKGTRGGENAGFKAGSAESKEGKLALYVCKVDGETKYVMPVYGNGLWGPISGYIAVDEDKATIYGAYFNHESETAGLGAEIKDNAEWQAKFRGKSLFAGERDNTIDLAVLKKSEVKDNTTQVDGVTGSTLTSNGVSDMLRDGLGAYIEFLNAKQ